jgi:hypothetical protein
MKREIEKGTTTRRVRPEGCKSKLSLVRSRTLNWRDIMQSKFDYALCACEKSGGGTCGIHR